MKKETLRLAIYNLLFCVPIYFLAAFIQVMYPDGCTWRKTPTSMCTMAVEPGSLSPTSRFLLTVILGLIGFGLSTFFYRRFSKKNISNIILSSSVYSFLIVYIFVMALIVLSLLWVNLYGGGLL